MVSVQNCTLTGFFTGIDIQDSESVVLLNNSVLDSHEGFFLSVDGSRVEDNTFLSDGYDFGRGLSVSGSNNVVTGNAAFDYQVTGIHLGGGSESIVSNNRASGNNVGFSVGGRNNVMTENYASGNQVGFVVGGPLDELRDSNQLLENHAAGNIIGYQLGGDGNIVNSNLATDNQEYGFLTVYKNLEDRHDDTPFANTVDGNTAIRNKVGFADPNTGGPGTLGTRAEYNNNGCVNNGAPSEPLGLCMILGEGSFIDDDGHIFEAAIEWLAAEELTKGCDPPFNISYCPDDPVTRGELAVFLDRIFDYTDDGGGNLFVDDDGRFYESAADRIKTAGVTNGCNPPANDRFCGDRPVTRGEFAALFVRAMGYTDNGGGNLFIDDDGHLFENAIDKLGPQK